MGSSEFSENTKVACHGIHTELEIGFTGFFFFLIFTKGDKRIRLLSSRADVLMKISKVVNSQRPCALHTQTGVGTAQLYSQKSHKMALLLLPRPDHGDPSEERLQ